MPCCGSRAEHFPARQLCDPLNFGQPMGRTWYVTFEVQRLGMLLRPRHPRLTQTFETETEAKRFAKEKLDQGLAVTAGTLNPHAPKQVIPSSAMSRWLGNELNEEG
jgi:hypothetical protein